MKSCALFSLWILVFPISFMHGTFKVSATTLSGARLESVAKIWDSAPHNAFTDLIEFDGAFYATFREASGHLVPNLGEPGGVVRLLRSSDGLDWDSAATFSFGSIDHDLRDPKLTVTPDGELVLLATDVPHASSGGTRQSYTWTSSNGNDWSTATTALNDSRWLWRTEWNPANNASYGISYTNNSTRLHVSPTGSTYATIVPTLAAGNEAAILFLEDGSAAALIRREGTGAQIGTSTNLTDWDFRDTGEFVGGPDMIQIPDGRIIVGGRFLDNFTSNPRTSLGFLDLATGTINEFLELPSGGDTGYPGLVWRDDKLWVSYYSSHMNNKASIYLASVSFNNQTDTFSRTDGPIVTSSIGSTESDQFTYEERGNTANQLVPVGTAQIRQSQLLITGSQQGAPTNSGTGGVYLASLDQADLKVSFDLGFELAGAAPSGPSGSDSKKFNNTALIMLRSREDQNFGSNSSIENGLVAVEIGPNGDLLIREQTGAGSSGLTTIQGSFNYFTNQPATREPLPGTLPATWGSGSLDVNQNGFLDDDESLKVRAELLGTSLKIFFNDLQYGPTFTVSQLSAAAEQANGLGLHKNRLGSSGGFFDQVVSNIVIDNLNIEIAVALPGDFDGDGDVDGRDFLAWQRGESPYPLSSSDLAEWHNSYNNLVQASSIAIPELATSGLLLASLPTLGSRNLRRWPVRR